MSKAGEKMLSGMAQALAFTRGELAAGVGIRRMAADGKLYEIKPEDFYNESSPTEYQRLNFGKLD